MTSSWVSLKSTKELRHVVVFFFRKMILPGSIIGSVDKIDVFAVFLLFLQCFVDGFVGCLVLQADNFS